MWCFPLSSITHESQAGRAAVIILVIARHERLENRSVPVGERRSMINEMMQNADIDMRAVEN